MPDWLLFGLVTASIVVPAARTTPSAQDDRVSGTVVIDGDTITLRHVLARRTRAAWDADQVVTQVLLTAEPVPAEALDGPFALLDAMRDGQVSGLSLEYDADGSSVSGQVLSSRLPGSLNVSRSGTRVRPEVFTTARIGGSFEASATSMDDQDVVVAVSWSARVQPMPVVVEPTAEDAAAALQHPAVQAWQAIENAIHAGDKAALLKVAPAQVRAMAQQPDFDQGFAMMKGMTPKVARYLRVTERNGKAIIEAEAPGVVDGKLKRGTITMVRDGDGVWWAETMTF